MNRIVVIGASSGGLEALRLLLAPLPVNFSAPICVVIHSWADSPAIIHELVGHATRLKSVLARNLDRLQAGTVYIAPPDCHLLVEPGQIRVTKGPRENRFRPAIDPLFRTAAQVYGPAAIGVVLTGNLDDGTSGLATIKQLGGTAIVQDPKDAMYPSMPRSALTHVKVDYCLPLSEIAPVLIALTRETVTSPAATVPSQLDTEVRIAKEENPMVAGLEDIASPSAYSCPECHGVLLQLADQDRVRFRCHTGHAYSIDSLLAAYGEQIEITLWNAIRSLEETALFLDRLTRQATASHTSIDADSLTASAVKARQDAAVLREMVNGRFPLVGAAATTH